MQGRAQHAAEVGDNRCDRKVEQKEAYPFRGPIPHECEDRGKRRNAQRRK